MKTYEDRGAMNYPHIIRLVISDISGRIRKAWHRANQSVLPDSFPPECGGGDTKQPTHVLYKELCNRNLEAKEEILKCTERIKKLKVKYRNSDISKEIYEKLLSQYEAEVREADAVIKQNEPQIRQLKNEMESTIDELSRTSRQVSANLKTVDKNIKDIESLYKDKLIEKDQYHEELRPLGKQKEHLTNKHRRIRGDIFILRDTIQHCKQEPGRGISSTDYFKRLLAFFLLAPLLYVLLGPNLDRCDKYHYLLIDFGFLFTSIPLMIIMVLKGVKPGILSALGLFGTYYLVVRYWLLVW